MATRGPEADRRMWTSRHWWCREWLGQTVSSSPRLSLGSSRDQQGFAELVTIKPVRWELFTSNGCIEMPPNVRFILGDAVTVQENSDAGSDGLFTFCSTAAGQSLRSPHHPRQPQSLLSSLWSGSGGGGNLLMRESSRGRELRDPQSRVAALSG